MTGIDWIFFDWGRTLTDISGQAAALQRGAVSAARVLGQGDGSSSQLLDRLISAEMRAAADPTGREADVRQVLRDWCREHDLPPDSDMVESAIDCLGQAWVGSLTPFPGVRETLAELRRRGYRLGLVSNCCIPGRFCEQELEREGLARYLDFATVSSEAGFRKPAPAIYASALEHAFGPRAQWPADLGSVLFVGDAPIFDVAAPANLGMRTALVACSPGTWPEQEYDQIKPDLQIDSVNELPKLLKRED